MKTKNKRWFYPFVIFELLIMLFSSCKQDDDPTPPDNYSVNTKIYTTLGRTMVPVSVPATSPGIFPYEISKFTEYGYGVWQYGPGLGCEKRLDLMASTYNSTSVVSTAKLLSFFALSDVHIMDKETPAQAIFFGYKGNKPSAYSPTMLYTTQVLDAAVRTINILHREIPFDFGISLGDNTNSNQYNELRWFIDVLDGKKINPDSGEKDDPIPGAGNDYQDEFKAEGLNETIPWYQTLGNHDHLWLGSYPVDDYINHCLTGENIIDMGDLFNSPLGIYSRGYYGGAIDGRTVYGDIIGAGPVEDFTSPPKVPAADPNRRAISEDEWKIEFFNSSSSPNGHGFNLPSSIVGCYSFEPETDIPVKVIVLDDTQREDNFEIHEHGYIDNKRYNWLISELDKGQAEGKLMIIAAHIPLPLIGCCQHSPISAETIINKLHAYPNFVMWMAGHMHRNKVMAFKSPDDAKPELGFWHVETSSLRDFPQQFRTFDIFRNSDNTISVLATNVDPAFKDGSLAAKSHSYAIATFQTMNLSMDNPSYNAELVKQLSAEMQIKIKNYGTLTGK